MTGSVQDKYNALRKQQEDYLNQPKKPLKQGVKVAVIGHTKLDPEYIAMQAAIDGLKPDQLTDAQLRQVHNAQLVLQKEGDYAATQTYSEDTNSPFQKALAAIATAQKTVDKYHADIQGAKGLETGYQSSVKAADDARVAAKQASDAKASASAADTATLKENAIRKAQGLPPLETRNPNAGADVPNNGNPTGVNAAHAEVAGTVNPSTGIGGAPAVITGKGTGSGNTETSSFTALPAGTSAILTPEQQGLEWASKYGVQAAFLASDTTGSIKELLNLATATHMSVADFTARLGNTDWAKGSTQNWQSAEMARNNTPTDYATKYNLMYDNIVTTAANLGITISPEQLGKKVDVASAGKKPVEYDTSGGNIVQWALDNSWATGFKPGVLEQHLNNIGTINTNLLSGSSFTNIQTLKNYYAAMGQNAMTVSGSSDPSDKDGMKYFGGIAKGIINGTTNLETEQSKALNAAKAMFPAYAAQLDAGSTIKSLAGPYSNALTGLLELPTDSIDMSSSTDQNAKMIKNAMGMGQGQTPQSVTDFESQVRKDPRWSTTLNAQDSVESIGHSVLKDMGFAF